MEFPYYIIMYIELLNEIFILPSGIIKHAREVFEEII